MENLKEAGAFGPRLLENLSLPRLGSLTSSLLLAGGGPPLRYGLLRKERGGGPN